MSSFTPKIMPQTTHPIPKAIPDDFVNLGKNQLNLLLAGLLVGKADFGGNYEPRFTKEELVLLKKHLTFVASATDCILTLAPYITKNELDTLLVLYKENISALMPLLSSWFTYFELPFDPNKSLDILSERIKSVVDQSQKASFASGLGLGLLCTPMFLGGILCLGVAAATFSDVDSLKSKYNLYDDELVTMFYQMGTIFCNWWSRSNVQQFSKLLERYQLPLTGNDVNITFGIGKGEQKSGNHQRPTLTDSARHVGNQVLSSPVGFTVKPTLGHSRRKSAAKVRRKMTHRQSEFDMPRENS